MQPLSAKTSDATSRTGQPVLTEEQQSQIFRAAGRRVAAAVRSQRAEASDSLLGNVAEAPVYGAFVTLKRAGQLRSCCGCLGPAMLLGAALDQAADRAATDDPRFPPISPDELPELEMHVWLLWGPQPVVARGEDRVGAVVIGKHGLQIARGHSRGLLLPGVAVEHHLDARGFLQQVCLKAGLPRDAWKDDDTTLLVFEGHAIEGPFPNEEPQRNAGTTRPPAVAGSFYPGTASEVRKMVDDLFMATPACVPEAWAGALVPHAGWMYSGRLAAAVLKQIQIPGTVIVLAPRHRGGGANWAVDPHARWAFPGGELAGDPSLASRLVETVDGLRLDAMSHAAEHAIEVQLPLLERVAAQTHVVGIVVGSSPLSELLRFGRGLADVLRTMPQRPLLLVSSDMNHFADEEDTRRLDQLALDAIQTLDPARVYETVQGRGISMCGMSPCIVVMEALRCLGSLNRCKVVGHTTSAESTGIAERVVGYAGILFG